MDWIALLSLIVSGGAFYLAWRSDQRAATTEAQVAQFREETNRPKLVFAGVRVSDQKKLKPEVVEHGANPVHVDAVTRIENFGTLEAIATSVRHSVKVGDFTMTPRTKNPDPLIIPPGKIGVFKWDLDETTCRRVLQGELAADIRVQIMYMGVGDRTYQYTGHYQYSREDDQFVCLGESNVP